MIPPPISFSAVHRRRLSGTSLLEIMVTVASALIIGGVALLIHVQSLDLFHGNTGINANHDLARGVVDRLEKEIQSAISIPALVAANRDVIDTTGPAPGVAFLQQNGPVRQVAVNALAGSLTVQLNQGPTAAIGQRLLIPAYDIEGDIVSVSGNTVTLAAALPADVKVLQDGVTRNIVAIITDLVTYLVQDGELRLYPNASSNAFSLIATGVTEPTPFTLPYNAVPGATPSS